MNSHAVKRRSLCTVCGKRLSERTRAGDIRWQPGRVDDEGIYCQTCKPPFDNGKKQKAHTDRFL